jgi:molecular chaperone GrpE
MTMNEENIKDKTTEPASGGENVEVRESPEAQETKIKELQDEKDQLFSRLQRAVADLQNYQKRATKERQEAEQRMRLATIELFLLPLVDDLDRALKAATEHGYTKDDPLFHGVQIVLQHAFGALKQHGIEPIEAEGKPFDPLFHEAVMEMPAENIPENSVVQVVTRGYTQDGKTIRPARVVIAKAPPPVQNDGQKQ